MTNNTGSTVILVSPKKLACTIYSLHDDLLLAIFLCCNQARFSFDEEDDFNSLSIQTSPWVLSHVCQRWRVLVVSAPLLWTTILLPMECFPVDPSGVISRLETVLQRSGDLELNVEIEDVHWSAPYHVYDDDAEERWNEERWNKSRTCVHSLIRLLLPTTVRWRHLIIFSSHDVFEALAGCSFGALQSLSIRDSCEDREDHEEDLSVTLFREAPKLRELKLGNNVGIDIHRGGIQTFTTESNGLLFLPGMQSLEALHIEEVNEDSQMLDQVRQNLRVFELPSLRTITVHEVIRSPVAYELSSHLRVTALKTLALLIWNRFGPPLLPHPLLAFDNLDSLVNLSIDFVEFGFSRHNLIPRLCIVRHERLPGRQGCHTRGYGGNRSRAPPENADAGPEFLYDGERHRCYHLHA